MTWTQQKHLVNSLSGRAHDKKRAARRVRANMKGWTKSYLGRSETLVWLFAAGSFWASGRFSTAGKNSSGRSIIAAINTSLLAWQMLNRRLKITQPIAGNPSDAPQ